MSVSVEVYLVPPLGVAVCSAVGRGDIMFALAMSSQKEAHHT